MRNAFYARRGKTASASCERGQRGRRGGENEEKGRRVKEHSRALSHSYAEVISMKTVVTREKVKLFTN